VSGNRRNEPNDLDSIAHHEIGHALFAEFKTSGKIDDSEVIAYHGEPPRLDRSDHFPGAVDSASRRGVFGQDYHGEMPKRRWLVTKFDLLVAQAVGYKLRHTPAFEPLTLDGGVVPTGRVGERSAVRLRASGGIPFYCFTMDKATLPARLQLDSFTGELAGVPTVAGKQTFVVRVRDYDQKSQGATAEITISVNAE